MSRLRDKLHSVAQQAGFARLRARDEGIARNSNGDHDVQNSGATALLLGRIRRLCPITNAADASDD